MKHIYVLYGLLIFLAASSLTALILVLSVQSHQNDTLSALICHAETTIKNAGYIKPVQKRRALRFYEQQIRLEHLKHCE